MRATIVAGLGGLVIGHMLWLVGIKLATHTESVNAWVLVVAGVSLVLALVGGFLGRKFYRQRAFAKAWFFWACPPLPSCFR